MYRQFLLNQVTRWFHWNRTYLMCPLCQLTPMNPRCQNCRYSLPIQDFPRFHLYLKYQQSQYCQAIRWFLMCRRLRLFHETRQNPRFLNCP
uniref:Uncharacterized protein n=1 Tax=viral metagenome TaxID=1070528 RepID=A0A6M3LM14_9ZZZZ